MKQEDLIVIKGKQMKMSLLQFLSAQPSQSFQSFLIYLLFSHLPPSISPLPSSISFCFFPLAQISTETE